MRAFKELLLVAYRMKIAQRPSQFGVGLDY